MGKRLLALPAESTFSSNGNEESSGCSDAGEASGSSMMVGAEVTDNIGGRLLVQEVEEEMKEDAGELTEEGEVDRRIK